MITIPRSLARTLRLVFSRGLGVSSRARQPPVEFRASGDGLVVRAMNHVAAVAHHHPGAYPEAAFAVPLDALKRCESTKNGPVTFERRDDDSVAIEWQDAGIPQLAQFQLDADETPLPAVPDRMQSNEPELLAALREAAECADQDATRYALNCLQLRSGTPEQGGGRVAATDSRQLLVQSGFAFPWDGEVLIPASRIFACRKLHGAGPVEIGRTDEWVAIRTGRWTVHLRIEQDAKFPNVDDHIPRAAEANSTLHLSKADAEFVVEAAGRLPAADEPDAPVTLDLGSEIAVRAQGEDQSAPTALVLTGSHSTGQRLSICTNREYLVRALQLGFRSVGFGGAEAPAFCQDERRSYVWALLGSEGAVRSAKNTTRIESPAPSGMAAASTRNPRTDPPTPEGSMSRPKNTTNGRAGKSHTTSGPGPDDNSSTSLLDQAETLKGTLSDALSQTRELIGALKKQKKQTRLMRSTLQSLKELQTIDA